MPKRVTITVEINDDGTFTPSVRSDQMRAPDLGTALGACEAMAITAGLHIADHLSGDALEAFDLSYDYGLKAAKDAPVWDGVIRIIED